MSKNRRITLHNAKELINCNWETEKCSVIGEIEIPDYNFGDLIEVNGKLYTAHTATQFRDHISVSEIFVDSTPYEKKYKTNVICPYCGYEEKDSWEMSDEENNRECPCCGGVYDYQRIVTVEYSSQPVKCPKPVQGKWIES